MNHEVDHLSTIANHCNASEVGSKEAKMPAANPLMSSPNDCPFLLRAEDIESLAQSDGFHILSQHMAEHCNYEFCSEHTPSDKNTETYWLITRDVLHALLVPVVELFDKASSVAEHATHASKIEDLEYAYTGDARGAFLWLSCFLEKERDWVYTKGCPACVVNHAMDSEFTIRLLYAACLLSDVHYPFTLEGPTLPSFMFFLESLHIALECDDLWGEAFFERMTPKAYQTRNGVEDLIHQCLELDALLSAPSTPSVQSAESSAQVSPVLGPLGSIPGTPGMKIKRSKMARRQMRLQVEQEKWTEQMLMQCWEQLQPATEHRLLPASVVSQRLDAMVKGGAVVAISEISPIT